MLKLMLRNEINKYKIVRLYSTTPKIREWKQPSLCDSYDTGIMVKNSLYKYGMAPFLISNSSEKNQRPISWYTCGPTVYSSSHIGHARNYITVDIIQRILVDYFRLNIVHVMGITDVDDKIINKSKQELISANELSRKFEQEFFEDLKSLNIKPPMFTTRVSEHIDEIIKYIQKIKENQLTYESTKSVIFDVNKFGIDRYCSLRAANQQIKSDDTLLEKDKKSIEDFVLWKAYNENIDIDGTGRPVSWDSPFGEGRPGWHIECSAMIDSIFKSHLDVHSGGVDLQFPHHQNEIAQCEGHSHYPGDATQWTDYFFHIGHLHLNSEKMSKSLGNVISIRDFLSRYPANTLRWVCLVHKYYDPVNFSEDVLQLCIDKEIKFLNWFIFIRSKLKKELTSVDKIKKQYKNSIELLNQLNETKYLVEKDLRDSFNTPSVIKRLELLMKQTTESINSVDTDLIFNVQDYIESILNMLGFDFSENNNNINNNNSSNNNINDTNTFLLETLLDLRSDLKDLIKEIPKNDKSLDNIKSKIYQLVDQVRDSCKSEISLRITDIQCDSTKKSYTIDWLDKNHIQLLNSRKPPNK
ncbi:hypothetical protein RB653_003050 [Dictyostelium firmibasis]|uniref:cysteine--tRNA ligase n=1 Tax=Dictyostelium firmibasis TaxID=79012 RepID=A0AAN7TXM3_9MYCE